MQNGLSDYYLNIQQQKGYLTQDKAINIEGRYIAIIAIYMLSCVDENSNSYISCVTLLYYQYPCYFISFYFCQIKQQQNYFDHEKVELQYKIVMLQSSGFCRFWGE